MHGLHLKVISLPHTSLTLGPWKPSFSMDSLTALPRRSGARECTVMLVNEGSGGAVPRLRRQREARVELGAVATGPP